MHVAAQKGSNEIIQLSLNHDVVVYTKGKDEQSTLQMATRGQEDIVQLLLGFLVHGREYTNCTAHGGRDWTPLARDASAPLPRRCRTGDECAGGVVCKEKESTLQFDSQSP